MAALYYPRGCRDAPEVGHLIETLVFIALGATVAVLIAGMVVMARGGDVNRKYGNLLMRARVGAQTLAVALMFALFLMKGGWMQ